MSVFQNPALQIISSVVFDLKKFVSFGGIIMLLAIISPIFNFIPVIGGFIVILGSILYIWAINNIMIRYEIYTVSGIDNFSFMDIRFKKRELVHLMRFIQIGVISLIVASPLFLIVYRFEKQISENPLYLIFISPIGLLIASFFLSRIGTMLPTAALEKNTTLRTSYKKSDKIWVSGLVTIFTISIIFSLIGFLFLFFYQYVENLFILHFLRILENTVDFISFASIAIALGYFYKAIEES